MRVDSTCSLCEAQVWPPALQRVRGGLSAPLCLTEVKGRGRQGQWGKEGGIAEGGSWCSCMDHVHGQVKKKKNRDQGLRITAWEADQQVMVSTMRNSH